MGWFSEKQFTIETDDGIIKYTMKEFFTLASHISKISGNKIYEEAATEAVKVAASSQSVKKV